MSGIDFFCSPDDRHRVILLVDLLEKAGQAVNLRSEPTETPTRPCLVACTRRAFREPWISALFTTAGQVAALRLDDAPLPGPAARIIDMQAWPARSADRNVAPLVDWLQFGGDHAEDAGAASTRFAARSGRRRAERTGRSPLQRRLADPNVLGGLALLGLLVVVGLLLAWSAGAPPVHAPAEPDEPLPPVAGLADPVSDSRLPAAERPGPPTDSASTGPTGSDAAGVTPAASTGLADVDAAANRTAAVAIPETADIAPPAASEHADALRHLCRARTIEAARAWAGALDWKQRRRLPNEPCVQQLLQRSGFEELAGLVDLS